MSRNQSKPRTVETPHREGVSPATCNQQREQFDPEPEPRNLRLKPPKGQAEMRDPIPKPKPETANCRPHTRTPCAGESHSPHPQRFTVSQVTCGAGVIATATVTLYDMKDNVERTDASIGTLPERPSSTALSV